MPVISEIYYHLHEGSSLGKSSSVVLIHGAGGTHLYFPSEIRRMPGQRVYAPDLPGHGKSGGRGLQSISGYAASISDWLTALGIHSAVFVGHSMGSAIALTLALDYPERVNGIVLIGAGARLKVSPQILEAVESPTTAPNAVQMVVNWSFSSATPPRLKELAGRRMAETRPSVLLGDFVACNGFDVTERVSQIQRPALILCGAEDRMTPLRQSMFLSEQIPNAELTVFQQAGHMVQLEQPVQVAARVQEFLASIQYM